jgi:hypothetical protein
MDKFGDALRTGNFELAAKLMGERQKVKTEFRAKVAVIFEAKGISLQGCIMTFGRHYGKYAVWRFSWVGKQLEVNMPPDVKAYSDEALLCVEEQSC